MKSAKEILDKFDELSAYLPRLSFDSPIHPRIFGQIQILEWVLEDEIAKRMIKINRELIKLNKIHEEAVSMRDKEK